MYADLPLPVAVLRRRAFNAKSAKDRHDSAYYAWEVSVRIAASYCSLRDTRALARTGLGAWAQAVVASNETLGQPALRAVAVLLSEAGRGQALALRKTSARAILDALPAYRNRVLGHGSVRDVAFYARAADVLLAALDDAWAQSFFLPTGVRLAFVESVEVTSDGSHRARAFDLTSESPLLMDPAGTTVPTDVQSGRLYAHDRDSWSDLHPWLLFLQIEGRERVFCFDSWSRGRARYLDYASGETLGGTRLDQLFPGVQQAVGDAFANSEPGDDADPARSEAGKRFGDFRILGKLGQGAMGVVYLARQESLGRLTALKMLPRDAANDEVAVARFRREVDSISRCDHANVVNILTYGEIEGTHFYAMEYVEGAPLSDVVSALRHTSDVSAAISTASDQARSEHVDALDAFAGKDGVPAVAVPDVDPTPLQASTLVGSDRYRATAALVRDAARGVHQLHEAGVIHRDLKPANIMVTARDHRAVVMDLGLAKLTDASRSLTRPGGSVLGTLRYMPPEQLQMDLIDVDRRADVYALGATLFELATGRPLFDGDTMPRLIEQVLHDRAPEARRVVRAVPDDLSAIIAKCVEKQPRARYVSAAALADDLEAFLEGRPVAARAPTFRYILGLAVRRHPWRAVASALALVGALGATAWFVKTERDARVREQALRSRAEAGLERAEDLNEFMLLDLGSDLDEFGRLPLLAKAAKRAQAFYDGLSSDQVPWLTRRGRALAYDRLADVFRADGNTEQALVTSRQAAQAFAVRYQAEPSDVDAGTRWASALLTQAGLLRSRRDLAPSEALSKQALALLVTMEAAGSDTEFVQRTLASAHRGLASLADMREDPKTELHHEREAERVLSAALDATNEPSDRLLRSLGWCLNAIGHTEWNQRGHGHGKPYFERALALGERVLKHDDGSAWSIELVADSARWIGVAIVESREFEAAVPYMERSAALYASLVARDPSRVDWQLGWAEALAQRGHVDRGRRNLGEAIRWIDRAATVLTKALIRAPDDARILREMVSREYELGRMHRMAKRYDVAERHILKMQDVVNQLIEAGDETPGMRLIAYHGLKELARICGNLERPADARVALQTALKRIEALREINPTKPDWILTHVHTLRQVGRVEDKPGPLYEQAIALVLPLVEADNPNPRAVVFLAELYNVLGWVRWGAGKYEESITLQEKVAALAEPLLKKFKNARYLIENAGTGIDAARASIRLRPILSGSAEPTTDAERIALVRHYELRSEISDDASIQLVQAFRDLLPPVRTKSHPDAQLGVAVQAADRAAGVSSGAERAGLISLGLLWLTHHLAGEPSDDMVSFKQYVEQIRGGEPALPMLRTDPRFLQILDTALQDVIRAK